MAEFKESYGWIRSVTPKSEAVKSPISQIFERVNEIPLKRGSHQQLELNLLYACYMASKAPPPDLDSSAIARRTFAAEKKVRPSVMIAISKLREYCDAHPQTAKKALAESSLPSPLFNSPVAAAIAYKFDQLKETLAELEAGLVAFEHDVDHIALISSDDFQYGPFEFHRAISDWKNKGTKKEDLGKNVIQVGLMFHLTYLFRYFSSPDKTTAPISLSGDILLLNGVQSIAIGRPYSHLVAALTNAVFKQQFSSGDVKSRLDNLSYVTPGAKTQRKAKPLFIGW